MDKKIVLSGIRPTGQLHLGNYLGALSNFVKMQNEGKYDAQDLKDFEKYIAHKLGKLERRLDQDELRKIFLGIYAGPVDAKKGL